MTQQNNSITERVQALRNTMKSHRFDAYIIPSSDGHLGEYTPDHWKGRAWISGFTGSAGKVAVTADKAILWTDSRYFLQSAAQIKGTPFELYKEDVPGIPTLEEFLSTIGEGKTVACDGNCFSQAQIEDLQARLAPFGIKIDTSCDLLDDIWKDRPEIPKNPFYLYPDKYSGEATSQRLTRIREEIKKRGADFTVITMMDELAWLFNIRNSDVECNPVGIGYGYLDQERTILFTFPEKVTSEVKSQLEKEGVTIMSYGDFLPFLAKVPAKKKLLVDKTRISHSAFASLPGEISSVETTPSVITILKSYKNDTERDSIRHAMLRDGVALTRFFMWLEKALASGETFTEVELDKRLAAFRAMDDRYICDSFDTICGYMDHGAIVHYRAQPDTCYTVRNEGVLLLDSGAQYKDATTDITRTIALGKAAPNPELIEDYTLVLKGHIAIATAQFPEGTRGNQLDILARKPLWDRGLSYGHGTGHGVGVALNVHEGPQNIRTDNNPNPMAINTFTSNEPGLYRAGKWGIRIENLILTIEKCQTDFGRFFGFETVTLCYLDNRLVDKSMLCDKEIKWYNEYQEKVYRELSPLLNNEEAEWLRNKTLPL